MTEIERRLHGVAAYNPDLLSKQELVAQFVARRELFAELVADLRRPKFTQHQLIVGHRGMGKTTLLRRLRYEVEDDPKLSARWIALAFPEEQYNVSRLSDLYLNCIDALGDALERTGRQRDATALDDAREKLPDIDENRRAAAALDLLLGTARRLDRRLLLLIDNLDLVLERLEAEQWTIRELLSRENRLLVIAATPFVIGSTYAYDAPFYEFFRVHELRGLSFEETSEVLATLAAETNTPSVERLVREEPARIRTLHVLAGGNPRTIVLLFSVLAQGTDGDVRTDLEKLLDQTTPLYKARFEALAPQAQQVVDALAIQWDPISAGELAEKLRLEVNVVSAQLSRLAQQGVVEKVPYDPPSKTGFQIAERFFNIWYLMRASRRLRRRLTWLVQFLRLFYGMDQLQVKARDLLRSQGEAMPLRQAEFCLAVAEALGQDRPTQLALESRAIRAMLGTEELRREMNSLFDLDGADAGLRPLIDRQSWAQEFRVLIEGASDEESADLLRLIATTTTMPQQQKLEIARGLAALSAETRAELRNSLTTSRERSRKVLGARLSRKLETAILDGYVADVDNTEDLSAASVALNMPELQLLPLGNTPEREKLAEIAHATDEPIAWAAYAIVLREAGRNSAAEEALSRAIAGEPGAFARHLIARVQAETGRYNDAIATLECLRQETPISPVFRSLAAAYRALGNRKAAAEALEQALEQTPHDPSLLLRYGYLLSESKEWAEAERVFETVVDLQPKNEAVWFGLADALSQQHKFAAALDVIERGLTRQQSVSLSVMRIAHLAFLNRGNEAIRALSQLSLDESQPVTTEYAVNVANYMMSAISWESAAALFRIALPKVITQFEEGDIPTATFDFFTAAVHQGHAARAAELLGTMDIQLFRPIYEALRIHAANDRTALNRLAPELREPVNQLLGAWQDEGTPRPPAKKKKKPAMSRKRSRRLH